MAALDGLNRFFRQWFDLDEPLGGEIRLHHGFAAVAVADAVIERLDFNQHPQLPQGFHHGVPACKAIQSDKPAGLCRHNAVVADHFDTGQLVPLPDFKVVGVVGRSDL